MFAFAMLLSLFAGSTGPAIAGESHGWGWGMNSGGALGDGTSTQSTSPVPMVGLPDDIIQIATGYEHSLALTADGSVWAWGENGEGQLGTGDNIDSTVPVEVSGLEDVTIVAISCGIGFSLALTDQGHVYSWGDNSDGALGDGTFTHSNVPTRITTLADIVDIASGSYHALALSSSGTVYAWGRNQYGQLGDIESAGGMQASPIVVPIPSSDPIVNIASGPGSQHSMAISASDKLYEWGFDYVQYISDTSSTQEELTRATPAEVAIIPGVVDAALGVDHNLVLTETGALYSWGWYVAAGIDWPTNIVETPQQVMSDVNAIAAGRYHSLALTTGGQVWIWGSNMYGQVGNGATVLQATPDQIMPTTTIGLIAAGVYHSLVLEADLTAPTTTATVDGPQGQDDWYRSATVTLSTDETATTSYSINGGDLLTYAAPFPLPDGVNTITYSSTDIWDNIEEDQTLTVKVDGTSPTIQPIQSQTLAPISPAGAPVVFAPVVADTLTPSNDLLVTCVDQFDNAFASGQYAPPGTLTTITCTVTDLAGNVASTAFTVQVLGSGDLFADLRGLITGLNLTGGTGQTLLTQVAIAEALANGGQSGMACLQLTSLDLQVKAQESKRRIDRRDAAAIYAQTQQIRNVIGCEGSTS